MKAGTSEQLRPLAPSQLKPQRSSPREVAVVRLRDMSAVRITRESSSSKGRATYAVSVSMSPVVTSPSCVPTLPIDERGGNFTDSASFCSTPGTPTDSDGREVLTTTKRMEDFAALRTKVYSLAGISHKGEACAFCTEALRRALWSESQYFHRNAAALSGLREDKLLETLVAIVSGLTKLCATRSEHETGAGATSPRALCRTQQQLPVLMHAFLCGGSC